MKEKTFFGIIAAVVIFVILRSCAYQHGENQIRQNVDKTYPVNP